MSRSILTLQQATVSRGLGPILAIDELGIKKHEHLALIGPNGSGKTSLMLTMAGLIPLSQGELLYEDRPITSEAERSAYRKNVTLVFQTPMLLDGDVRYNVAYGLNSRGMRGEDLKQRVEENLERFNIAHLAQRHGQQLSGGEARRVSLARAMALEPKILFLDEPFTSLDAASRDMLIIDLVETLKDAETTLVLSTHDRSEAMALSEVTAVITNGVIAGKGATETMLAKPVNEFSAAFSGMETIIRGKVAVARRGIITVQVGTQIIEAVSTTAKGASVTLGVMPGNVVLSHKTNEKDSARNRYRALVTGIVRMGPYWRVSLDCGFPLVSHVTGDSMKKLNLREGVQIDASFKATSVHVVRAIG